MPQNALDEKHVPIELPVGHIATGKRAFPNVAVVNHAGQPSVFYDDYVKGRIVLLHFISTSGEQSYAVMPYVRKIANMLGDRLGKDVFIVSIASDPVQDDVAALERLARRFSVGSGWSLLTGEPQAMQILHSALFVKTYKYQVTHERHAATTLASGSEQAIQDCSVGLMRYGSDVTGFWGSVPVRANPDFVLQKLSWLTPQAKPGDETARLSSVRRKGPNPPSRVG